MQAESILRQVPPWHFDPDSARRNLCGQFGTRDLSGFGLNGEHPAIPAAGCLLHYAGETQRAALPHIRSIRLERQSDTVMLDAVTQRNLELVDSLSGDRDRTLAGVLDACATAMGSRLLRRWLLRPLRDRRMLHLRLQALDALIVGGAHEHLHRALREIGDIERILARVALRSARPRDLAQLRGSIAALPRLRENGQGLDSPLLAELFAKVGPFPDLGDLLRKAIVATPPIVLRDGGSSPPDSMPSWTSIGASPTTPAHSCMTLKSGSGRVPASPDSRSATTGFTATTSRSRAASPNGRRRTTLAGRPSSTPSATSAKS